MIVMANAQFYARQSGILEPSPCVRVCLRSLESNKYFVGEKEIVLYQDKRRRKSSHRLLKDFDKLITSTKCWLRLRLAVFDLVATLDSFRGLIHVVVF